VAARYALPPDLADRHGIRRYGFHGLAHQSMLAAWQEATERTQARVISLQLGAGCSITASRDGRPVETSMGFSHQDPGFIDHVVNKKADVIRVYLPPDANTLTSSIS